MTSQNYICIICFRRRVDRVEFDRDYDRSNFRDKPSRGRRADSRERFYDERERDYGRNRGAAPPMGGQPPPLWAPPRDPYYPEQPGGFSNRYLTTTLTVSRLLKFGRTVLLSDRFAWWQYCFSFSFCRLLL